MLIGVFIGAAFQYYSMSTITTVVDVIKTPNPSELCIDQLKNVSRTAIKLETKFPFIDIYYLIEGASKVRQVYIWSEPIKSADKKT